LPSAGNGLGVHTEEFGDVVVPSVAQLEGLEAGIQAALSFIEGAEEQQDDRLGLLRREVRIDHEKRGQLLSFSPPLLF